MQIQVNGQQTFFLNEYIVSRYSERLKKMIKEGKKRIQMKRSGIEMDGFPGGAYGFELVSRFCYNNGSIKITVSNVCLLYCCSVYLSMSEKGNLLQQTESFLEGVFDWSWNDVVTSLKSCESFFTYADSCNLMQKVICALLAKIAQNSDLNLIASSSSETSTPESITKRCSSSKEWWFDDLTTLPPMIIEKIIKSLGAYGTDNDSLTLTRFLLHYLKSCVKLNSKIYRSESVYGGLADTAVHGVILVGKSVFSCRRLFWVLRIVSGFGVSKDCRAGLEKMIGGMLELATLDDLLVSASGGDRGVYDVNFVLKLIRIFVNVNSNVACLHKMSKVSRLVDKYLGEISPDQNLKVSKFLGVAESLPDSARHCFDGVYRAVDIYLESHPNLSFKERSTLCRCINYEKLTLEACKDLAKNPRIPPNVAVQALMSQGSNLPTHNYFPYDQSPNTKSSSRSESQMVLYNISINDTGSLPEENENKQLDLEKMQWRVVELEKVCREMKGQMLRLVKHKATPTRTMPRLC